jgi:hypothetical protein
LPLLVRTPARTGQEFQSVAETADMTRAVALSDRQLQHVNAAGKACPSTCATASRPGSAGNSERAGLRR